MPRTTRYSRSPEAQAYRKLYKLALWCGPQGLRAQQLSRQPLCERCRKRNLVVRATVVNHRIKHEGDMALFADPLNLESVCKPCHDGHIHSEEALGYSLEISIDGWPSDVRHPANKRA